MKAVPCAYGVLIVLCTLAVFALVKIGRQHTTLISSAGTPLSDPSPVEGLGPENRTRAFVLGTVVALVDGPEWRQHGNHGVPEWGKKVARGKATKKVATKWSAEVGGEGSRTNQRVNKLNAGEER